MQGANIRIIDVDANMIEMLDLEGVLCFRCPLLNEYHVQPESLFPFIEDEKSGIKAAVNKNKILGYAVFGRPEMFPNLNRLPFPTREDALLIAALYATPEARKGNVDVDLLVAVMDFAGENDFEVVQAVCRSEVNLEPEGRTRVFRAAGFTVSEPVEGLCFAETTVKAWDGAEKGHEGNEVN